MALYVGGREHVLVLSGANEVDSVYIHVLQRRIAIKDNKTYCFNISETINIHYSYQY